MDLIPPVTYQGGKQRLAKDIIQIIKNKQEVNDFYDLCCGSGAISIELVNQGLPPEKISMVDRGPWGLFWKLIGIGKFDIQKFADWCCKIPKNKREIKEFMQELSKQPANIDTPYVYLILQASSFGGKAIWIEQKNNQFHWRNCSFRSYWEPTPTSNRRSPVNPMMPMPETLLKRTEAIAECMKGVKGYFNDIFLEDIPQKGVVYIDPPYKDTTMYGSTFDVKEYVKLLNVPTYVSEGEALSENAVLVSQGRKKGGISGERKKKANEEWVSIFHEN